jgi:uncharacterized protein YndB with AHSA1/START domain
MRRLSSSIVALLILAPSVASPEVIDRGPAGFTLKTVVDVAAPPDRVFRTLVDVGSWWDREHTYTGDAMNLSIDPRPGGCFCERFPNGASGVEHGRVVNVSPGSLLRISGALGPLQELGVAGALTFQIAKSAKGSTVTMTYAVGGYAPGGLEKLAPLVDSVMSHQVQLLKQHLEKPDPGRP